MLYFLIAILGILITIFFVIGTHEFAHFITARWVGIKVLRFSIGFGKTLWRRTDRQGTEYVLSLIPLGGYVKMLDEREDKVSPEEKKFAFNNQAYYKKMLVILAGPLMNILCAWLLYCIIFMVGVTTIKPIIGSVTPLSIAASAGLKPNQEILNVDNRPIKSWTSVLLTLVAHAGNNDHVTLVTKPFGQATTSAHTLNLSDWTLNSLTPDPLESIGITPFQPVIPVVIGHIAKNAPADKQLKLGDELLSINNVPIKNWNNLITLITKNPNQTLSFQIKRSGKVLTQAVTTGSEYQWFSKIGYLGIGPNLKPFNSYLNHLQYSPPLAMVHAAKQLYDFVYFNILLIGKLIVGKISLQSLGGPITIFDSAGVALNIGFLSFLSFLAFLSISIGVINFLPIPGLDGGHLLLQTIEKIIGRTIPDAILNIFYRVGFSIILIILSIALVNDLLRLANGI